ncbi:hypothetical protein P7K49_032514, partial [Saguinus oedipus]
PEGIPSSAPGGGQLSLHRLPSLGELSPQQQPLHTGLYSCCGTEAASLGSGVPVLPSAVTPSLQLTPSPSGLTDPNISD